METTMSTEIPLDPATSASPVLISLIKTRCRQHLRIAIDSVRSGEVGRAEYHVGIAEGQVAVLYDTAAVAWRYKRAVEAVRRAIARLAPASGGKLFRLLDGNGDNVMGGDLGEDNAYIRAYGALIRGERPVAKLAVGEATRKRYSLSGQKPTIYRILRVR